MTQLVEERLELFEFDLDVHITCDSIFGCTAQAIWSLVTACCGNHYGVFCDYHKNGMIKDYKDMVEMWDALLVCKLCGTRGLTYENLLWNLL